MTDMIEIATITTAIRNILRHDERLREEKVFSSDRLHEMRRGLQQLEREVPSRDPSAFETPNLDAFGYATVLGYLNEQDPLSLMDLEDPVRDSIALGRYATALCLKRGLKVVRVPACQHIKDRYRKVTKVNAYPISVLAEVIFGAETTFTD